MEIVLVTDLENPMEEQFWERKTELCCGHVKFEMAFDHPGGDVK